MESTSAPARLRALPSWLLNQAARPAQHLVTEGLRAVGAQRYHYSVLAALDEFGPASQIALGRRSGIDRSDMVAVVNDLTAQGSVSRQPDATDRRRNVVTITPAGHRHLQALDDIVNGAQRDLLAPLSADERAELVRLLGKVVDHHAGG